ncbi:unnamed protein product, partial [Choristocarpus tenellus]
MQRNNAAVGELPRSYHISPVLGDTCEKPQCKEFDEASQCLGHMFDSDGWNGRRSVNRTNVAYVGGCELLNNSQLQQTSSTGGEPGSDNFVNDQQPLLEMEIYDLWKSVHIEEEEELQQVQGLSSYPVGTISGARLLRDGRSDHPRSPTNPVQAQLLGGSGSGTIATVAADQDPINSALGPSNFAREAMLLAAAADRCAAQRVEALQDHSSGDSAPHSGSVGHPTQPLGVQSGDCAGTAPILVQPNSAEMTPGDHNNAVWDVGWARGGFEKQQDQQAQMHNLMGYWLDTHAADNWMGEVSGSLGRKGDGEEDGIRVDEEINHKGRAQMDGFLGLGGGGEVGKRRVNPATAKCGEMGSGGISRRLRHGLLGSSTVQAAASMLRRRKSSHKKQLKASWTSDAYSPATSVPPSVSISVDSITGALPCSGLVRDPSWSAPKRAQLNGEMTNKVGVDTCPATQARPTLLSDTTPLATNASVVVSVEGLEQSMESDVLKSGCFGVREVLGDSKGGVGKPEVGDGGVIWGDAALMNELVEKDSIEEGMCQGAHLASGG